MFSVPTLRRAARAAVVLAAPLSLAANCVFRGNPRPTASLAANPPTVSPAVLGRNLFFDTRLSIPSGVACATCHAPAAGWTNANSADNLLRGVSPGAVAGRFGNRNAPTISYASYIPEGPPVYDATVSAFVGGLFWDGRATDLADQATFPLQNPNEMNNVVHNLGDPALVVQEVARGATGELMKQVYGADVFTRGRDSSRHSLWFAIRHGGINPALPRPSGITLPRRPVHESGRATSQR